MISVIGLGEVGIETFKELNKKRDDVFGVDINNNLLDDLKSKGYKNVGTEIPLSEVYILAVYLTDQVFDVLKKIDFSENPLVVLESTLMPGAFNKIKDWAKENSKTFSLVLFPHRFNPNDAEHHVFNLDRTMGGSEGDIQRALEFYKEFMPTNLIHKTSPDIAELSKPLENAYRFTEIAIAEELKKLCETRGINFEELRSAVNTKWNIDIKEARDGIGGKCLPKDVGLINEFFKGNRIFETVIEIDEDYKKTRLQKEP